MFKNDEVLVSTNDHGYRIGFLKKKFVIHNLKYDSYEDYYEFGDYDNGYDDPYEIVEVMVVE